ncbi:MAG: DNA primase [Bacteroidales bacterium]|nr:DNA primase [Bacteroidales bacterium]
MITQETVQRILDTARIEEVVGDFVKLTKRGSDWWGCCPFHNEKTPSFHVVPAKGIYYCFGCHKVGSAVGFVMDHEHMSYPDALRYLARKYDIEIEEEEETAEQIAGRQRNESLLLVSEYAGSFFQEKLREGEGKAVGLSYFHMRGLEDETIEKYGLGWAPSDRHSFTDAAKAKGFKDEYLLETGLCTKYDDSPDLHDRFVERVTFPIHSVSGRVIAFGARTLKSKVEGKPYAKYVNSKESAIYVKNQSLYGIWFAKTSISRENKCYLVEGYLDVLSMHQLGITNVVASSGTALTEGQIRLIRRFTENVTIMYDGDPAGIHAALRGIGMFLKQGMNVSVVLLPDGDDPDSYSRKHSLAEVKAFLKENEKDFVEFKSSLLMEGTEGDPLKRANVINDIADTVADIPDAVKRDSYISFLSQKFDIRREALEERISSTRSKTIVSQARTVSPSTQKTQEAAPASVQPAPTGLEVLETNHIMGKAERDLLAFILTYGTTVLEFQSDSEFFTESEEDRQTVFEFIDQALDADNTEFVNPAYKAVYDVYSEMYDEGFSQEEIVKKMLDGADRTTAYIAAQLSTEEQYDLTVKNLRDSMMSKVSWLTKYVPKAILVYQSCRLEDWLSGLKVELNKAQAISDSEKEIEVMTEMVKIQKMLISLKKRIRSGSGTFPQA